jgi:acetylornithine deacetylase/succinyl-diaminopimelate desuccinylase-like protein
MARDRLRDEATTLLQELLRLDTTNPPGNETQAAELLRDYLEEAGVSCDLLAAEPGRANLVARIPGAGDGKRFLLLSHTDVVPADAADWTVPPFSGELRDDCVWGRGALDMKGQVAAAAVATATLAREGFRPRGDILFAATADEEVGTTPPVGLSWLCREHPEVIRAEYCVNEGGGDRALVGGRPVYLCAIAEKRSSPFLLRVRGRAGHASAPMLADNALVKAARLVERLGEFRPARRLLPETEAFFAAVTGRTPTPESLEDELAQLEPPLGAMIEPILSLTIAPTMISASRARNVVPATCEVVCDCRLLPGQSQEEAEAEIRAALGPDGYELEWIESVGGTRSSQATPLWDVLADWVSREEPGATLAPVVLSGFTDSHFLRETFGTVAYGFFPLRTMSAEDASLLVHSADERIHVDDLALGTRFLLDTARAAGSSL